jgi:signal peptidase II
MKSRYLISISILVLTLVIDFYTKQWGLTLETLHYNQGFIMGAFAHLPDSMRVIALGSFSGIVFILYVCLMYVIPRRGQWLKFGLSFLVGGMLGNVSDKIIYGQTVDFIPFILGDFHVYFNVADVFLWAGASITLWMVFAKDKLIWYPDSVRGNYLIRPREQLKVSLNLLLVVFCCSTLLGLFSYSFLNTAISGTTEEKSDIMNSFFYTYMSLTGLLCLIAFVAGVIISHKSAGPVYAFELYVSDLIKGKDRKLKLREGDNYRHLEDLADKLRDHFKSDKTPLE